MSHNLENDLSIYKVEFSDAGTRLDVFVASKVDVSRSSAVKLIENGDVSVNGSIPQKNMRLNEGDAISVTKRDAVPMDALPQNIPLDIIFEDNDIIVINKPCGMVVHPAAGNYEKTLVNALLYHCKDSLSGIGGVMRPGIVHRIDKDTSGLIVAAKNDNAHMSLAEQLKTHAVSRIYYAVAVGNLKEDKGIIDAPVGRHPVDRKKMAVFNKGDAGAKEAITHFRVLERYTGFTFAECELETGRTHQIRVHMASRGHPLLGDTVYGGDKTKFYACNKAIIHGQCLHAGVLCLTHPKTGVQMRFQCPLPNEMRLVLDKLRKIQF